MNYTLSWQGMGQGVAPDDPYDELCPACGDELHACQCPVDADYDEWDADYQARIDAGEIAVPDTPEDEDTWAGPATAASAVGWFYRNLPQRIPTDPAILGHLLMVEPHGGMRYGHQSLFTRLSFEHGQSEASRIWHEACACMDAAGIEMQP